MTSSHIILDLPRSEINNSKRDRMSLRITNNQLNHLKISHHTKKTTLQVRNKLEVESPNPSHKTQEITYGLTKTPCLNKISLVGILSCKSWQEKTTNLEGDQLTQMRGRVKPTY